MGFCWKVSQHDSGRCRFNGFLDFEKIGRIHEQQQKFKISFSYRNSSQNSLGKELFCRADVEEHSVLNCVSKYRLVSSEFDDFQ
jgi:hypothetical protein